MAKKTLQIEESTAREVYKKADTQLKSILEESFGKEFFEPKIQDRVKTIDDVLRILKLKKNQVIPYAKPKNKAQRSANAFALIPLIAKVLNGKDWIPDFLNTNQYKYYPWFRRTSGGWVGDGHSGGDVDVAHLGSGFYFKNSELALYAGNQFLEIYKDYLPE
jgi:hypothetical protein